MIRTQQFSFIALALMLNASVFADTIEEPAVVTTGMCPSPPTVIPIADEFGSVGLMKNLAEHPESMRVVAGRLLKSAVETPEFLAPSACLDECTKSVRSEVIYEVAPTAFLPEKKQQQVCLDFEANTKKTPMQFGPKTFASVNDLHEWITDFTRGKGDEGKTLYDRCSANCSPRYTFYIQNNSAQLRVNADVLCGLARDRDVEMYSVSTKIRHTCLGE